MVFCLLSYMFRKQDMSPTCYCVDDKSPTCYCVEGNPDWANFASVALILLYCVSEYVSL